LQTGRGVIGLHLLGINAETLMLEKDCGGESKFANPNSLHSNAIINGIEDRA
jgi:hypothetical protein